MASFQSTFGDEPGTAEELAKGQREIPIAEFFEKNKHILDFDSGARGLVTAVKEAMDNALDVMEEAGIQPDIYVEIAEAGDYYRLIIEDNGPGITREQMLKVLRKLLYGSRFHAREQFRGQQGIGISAAVLCSQLTSGKPAKVTSRIQGSEDVEYFELVTNTNQNEPETHTEKTTSWDHPHGTRIELEMEANMRARQQLHDYIPHTTVANPHVRVEPREPGLDEPMEFKWVTNQLPRQTKEIRPRPHDVEPGMLLKMLSATESYSVSGFLQEEFTRVGAKTSDKIHDTLRDRHLGREMMWRTPGASEADDLVAVVGDAVANKGKEAIAVFADELIDIVAGKDRIVHGELAIVVENAAKMVGEGTDTPFDEAVRENVVEALWPALTDDHEGDVYTIADDVAITQKGDAGKPSMVRSIATQFAETTGPADRITRDDVAELVSWVADRTKEREDKIYGETVQENIADAIWSRMRTVPDEMPEICEVADDRDVARDLLDAMRETDVLVPPTDCLSPISVEPVEVGSKKELDADFYAAAIRDVEVYGGDPFIVKAGITYGGELEFRGKTDLLRSANRVPLVYQQGVCTITHVVKGVGWRNYGLDQPGGSGMSNGPTVLMVHVVSTNVFFTNESKDALADMPAIQDEVEPTIRETARGLKSYLLKWRPLQKRREKQDVLGRILPQMAVKLLEVTGRPEPSIDDVFGRIMNNPAVEQAVDDGEVTLTATNHSNTNESPDITDIVSAEPDGLDGEATVAGLDGEWLVKWNPEVPSGETATLTYSVIQDTSFDIDVDSVETKRLTVNV